MKMKISTNFTKGFCRVLNLRGTKKWPQISNTRKADYQAIRSDWENVGKSIRRETEKYKRGRIN